LRCDESLALKPFHALTIALFINAAILILAAAAFHWSGHQDVAQIQDAYKLLSPVLGVTAAGVVFAIGLLASGQQATFTGTLAGQIVMEGFLQFRIAPWLRRLITRLLAIAPAICVIGLYGESRATDLLVFSQVVLSVQNSERLCKIDRGLSIKLALNSQLPVLRRS
jgi:manganese transport protein